MDGIEYLSKIGRLKIRKFSGSRKKILIKALLLEQIVLLWFHVLYSECRHLLTLTKDKTYIKVTLET